MHCAQKVGSEPCAQRLREHLLAQLVCPGRHTITSLLTTNGKQFQDWSPDYNLYAKERVELMPIFDQIRTELEALLDPDRPLVVALDDTILRKTGRRIPGTAYRKDPLGPAFHINLVWAQRILQLAAAVPGPEGAVRMIPINCQDASTPRKPRRDADPLRLKAYREEMKQANLNARACHMLHTLQAQRTPRGGTAPPLHLLVDGSYTNRTILRALPPNTTLIGRIRKDAHLNYLPQSQPAHGRPAIYGPVTPTPEELRADTSMPWVTVRAYAAGKRRTFRVKSIAPLRWRVAGKECTLRLLVIAPTPYLKRRGGKRLYRQPAYLICTDPDLPLEQILQEYVWRWDIEVCHRDVKTVLGVGEAQVRNPHSAKTVPASAVAAYSMLHLAAIHAYGWKGQPQGLPLPKWRNPRKKKRASTLDLINELRREMWASAIRPRYLSHFVFTPGTDTKSEKTLPSLYDAIFYATA